jgi:tetratricopeptide (TPR) repeat protein
MSRKSKKDQRAGKGAPAGPARVAMDGAAETKVARAQSGKFSWDNPWLQGLLLAILTFAAYQRVWGAGFIWDDDGHVTSPGLRSLDGLWRIWSEPGATQQYYPVLHSFFWVEHRLWGDSPLGYHLVNVLWHVVAAFLLGRVLRKLALPGALLAAAVFAVHPVGVESVAWISEQKNTLSMVFDLAAALAYFRFAQNRRVAAYAVATGFFCLALATKSVTATLPAALLVVSWWQRGRLTWQEDVRPLLPWFVLAAGAAVVTVGMERVFIGAKGVAFALGPAGRVLVAGRAVWFYLGKLFWPVDLTFIYPHWDVNARAAWPYLFPVATAAILAGLYAIRKRTRGPLAVGLLFVGTLFPALGFINVYPFVYSYVADHFQYLAAAMMISGVVAGGVRLGDRLTPAGRTVARMAAMGLVVTLAVLTGDQCAMYVDAGTLWRTTLARNPGCWMACDNLGNILLNAGKLDQAAAQFQRALEIKPGDDFAQNNLGLVLLHGGQIEPAVVRFEKALKTNPQNAEAHNNLGLAFLQEGQADAAVAQLEKAVEIKDQYPAARFNLGNALLRAGRTSPAIAQFERALVDEPTSAEIHNRLAVALLGNGRRTEAVAHFQEAIARADDYAEPHFNLGDALFQDGMIDQALAHYRRGLEIEPKNARARINFAHALLQEGKDGDGEAELRKALEAEPGDPEANNDLGVVLLQKGRREEAVAHFRLALATNDDYAEAHFNLANILLQAGAAAEAAAHYRKALQIEPDNARTQNNLGLALLQDGKDGEAVAHFRRALEIDPNYAQARRNLDIAAGQKR